MSATLQPEVLKWARKRAHMSAAELAKKLKVKTNDVTLWERTGHVPYDKVGRIAAKTYTPVGFLFLDSPPQLSLPIADFRRTSGANSPPSAELLYVLHGAQSRQRWYRDHQIANDAPPLPFVKSVTLDTPVMATARDIRERLRIGSALTCDVERWEDAIRFTIEQIESGGILVLRTGVAGSPHRKLSVEEFEGFALADEFAPLIFINGADFPSAQMFTIVHEVAHIWLGVSGVSNLDQTYATQHAVERYCNEVAAEVLVPSEEMAKSWRESNSIDDQICNLSKRFKVSRIVVARRACDMGFISQDAQRKYYAFEAKRAKTRGGNYYANEQYLNSRRFSVALLLDTRAGKTLYHDAMELLGIKKDSTFRKYAQKLHLEL